MMLSILRTTDVYTFNVKPLLEIPTIFHLATVPQPCNIRIMPVFKNPEDVRDIVRCCPNHTMDNVDKTSKSDKVLLIFNKG